MGRRTAEQRIDSWSSTPIVNAGALGELSVKDLDELQQLIVRLHRIDQMGDGAARPPGTCVDHLKALLGKQTYCWHGEYRYWVWEIEKRARIFASTVQGISFEVGVSLTAQEQLAELRKFVARWRAK